MTDAAPELMSDAPKPVRKHKSQKPVPTVEAAKIGGVRDWKALVEQMRVLRDGGATVPVIAEQLQVPYVLVNQVMLQSYKMTVDTVGMFERFEARRLAAPEA